MKVTLLGTGTSTGVPQIGCRCMVCTSTDPRDRRLRCSALIEAEDVTAADGVRRILIDCGPDFREQMLRVDFKRLDAILITHEHYDHVGGLDDLRPFSIFGDVVVYAEPYTADHLRQRIPYCFTPKEKRYPGVPSIDLEEMKAHVPVHIGGVEVLPLRVMHGKLPILGFRIGDFAYITDMLMMPDEDVALLKGVKKMVVNGLRHEPHMSHQTLEDAVRFTERLGCPEAWLIHMSHHIRPHAVEEQWLPQHVHLAYDNEQIIINNE
ncbi:MAG: MBL fold metallo-hydrolase [Bacteroidaceae bacterium]|nr:MBL fold metallo-hydrolase [Bacteroidaceae bacterium]